MNEAEVLFANILSLGEHPTWENCIAQVEPGLQSWLYARGKTNFRRIYIVGCGTSHYAAQVGKYVIESVAHVPVEAHQAFAFSLYTDPALLTPETLVMGITTTGTTESVCSALEFARRCGAETLVFTAVEGSKITQIAQSTILTGGRVTVAVKTETYLQSLICLYLFAAHLAIKTGNLHQDALELWHAKIQTAEEITRRFFDIQQPEIRALVDKYGASDMVYIVGTGPNVGTAEEASLKVVEIAKMYSVSKEMEDFFHGYDRELNNSCPMFFISPKGPALRRMLDFLTFNRKVGMPSIVLTDETNPDVARLSDQVILLPSRLDEIFTPLIYIAPFYLFGYHMAVKRGFDPSARRFPGIVAIQTHFQPGESD